ncbi:MAG: sensor histidine kinase [Boseongicola sp. SB0664_bin_43]|uniref:histidine kinase n=1 Tax=Boseongicola sp. SB0664_bin_43 TaxID=2604844 RepID=A0A6B0XZ57_9RHOB|nr:sensor histidine kinase [Boseongicola sp. SB0664_bin_43]
MSFSFEARTLLELGKELISTDEVALYELIKNAVDAGSPKVEIRVRSSLAYTDYREAVRRLRETREALSEVTSFIRGKMVVDDRDQCEACLSELDRITDREIYGEKLDAHYAVLNSIAIKDTGEGMSLDDLNDVYLRIGTRHRRRRNEEGATYLGDKGIGRLSAMRLGNLLTVLTSKEGESHWNVLNVNWGVFSHSDDMLVQDIEIAPKRGKRKTEPNDQGTAILIRNLNADWTLVRFKELLDGKIARFIDPFEAGLANRLLVARHNGKRVLIPSIPKALMKHAHASCRATFRFEDGDPVIDGRVDYREKQRATVIEARGSEVMTVSRTVRKRRAKRGHAAFEETPISRGDLAKLGGFDLEVYWYNRRIVDSIEGLTESKTATRAQIARWSGGPMLYRYGFRVLPFGDPDDDWISLDKMAFGSAGFKLNRQQIFGRIRIETPHLHLSEQTNREGLVQSEVSDALKRLVTWIINVEFRNFINQVDKEEKLQFRKEELENNQILRAERTLLKAVSDLRSMLDGSHEQELKEVMSTASALREEALGVLKRLEEVERQSTEDREKFVYLAGVGLMTEFVFHELERAVAHTMKVISEVGVTPAGVSTLKDQLQPLHKRVSAFDELTGEKRQTKSRFDLRELVREVLANHEREFERHNIDLVLDLPKADLTIRAVRGMVIQILENLVVNAAYWLKRQTEYEEGFMPQLTVAIDEDGPCMTVLDNGPGVPASRKERIFQPFVTTKPSGMGKGLGLFIARDMAEYHDWSLQTESKSGRVRPNRVNGFVLDMGKA